MCALHFMQVRRFTLVELLVVIAIISILAALLMPSLFRAVTLARSSSCQNNLRMWALYLNAYSDQNNGCFPDSASLAHGGASQAWGTCIETVMERTMASYGIGAGRSFGVWQCPENKAQTRPMGYGNTEEINSYQPNGGLAAPQEQCFGVRVSAMRRPSKLYAMYDGGCNISEPWYNDGIGTLFFFGVRYVRYAHAGNYNLLFADSHVTVGVNIPMIGRGTIVNGEFVNKNLWYATK